ncbi:MULTISPECIES: PHP domain-containing protein [Streptomyces]|uniref:PHP domain-containing protein n=1 Tax=Streptomyces glycanivorans TaxID=3033808 RepID=A0ABY9J9H0_9ACTN|nr:MULTISPECIES: PHP domain-containing protein [unclassified Streptomyces]WSQ77720.1 PHP domain-containing protein [Streptomyces sp. NBC_01213]TXS17918.1 PHP domain-containing protein [Streptomyces sp. wa22]WLQ64337.1 PHP domain-containing protein [Streptomyces sp. Alt3]WSQ85090.1 PHP domain-containing protein [Streptomyces sp. NBC_01212]WSR08835.1 PHP domain-containing protein [Streptomyces sp. NBC_01208]
MRIDLHTHSTASDGTDTPAELVANAAAAGLDVVALTDHDTVGGHAEAAAALPEGLTLVTGAELSCQVDGVSLHMLAYLFDPAEPELARERELVRDDRVPRAQAMVLRLQELGVPITWEQVARIAGNGSVGRPHVATALVELGVVDSVSDAFTSAWLGNGGRAYAGKHELDPFDAVRLVKAAGGVTVFAHPLAVKRGAVVPEAVIARLAEAGLDGIEVDHMDHDESTRARLRGLAADLGLLTTGSSDYHGSRKTVRLGEYTTDPEIYGEITRRATGAFPVPGAGGPLPA